MSSFLAELKDYVERPGRESALGQLAAARKIQENFYFTLARHGCQAMPASRPPSGHHSPAPASGRRSPATLRSLPLSTEERLLCLLDLDNRHNTDSEDEFPSVSGSISHFTTRGMSARSAVLSEGTSPVPVLPLLFAQGGGIAGGLGGLGGGAGNVPPLEQAPRALVQSSPRTRILLPRFIHPRTQTGLKDVFSFRRRKARTFVLGRWAPPSASAWPSRI